MMKEAFPGLHPEEAIRKIAQELMALAERLEISEELLVLAERLREISEDDSNSSVGPILDEIKVDDHIYEVENLAAPGPGLALRPTDPSAFATLAEMHCV